MKLKKISLHRHAWTYFLLFSFSIILILWLTQGVFFDKYYENYKSSELAKSAKKIVEMYNTAEFYDYLEQLAYEDEFCVDIEKEGTSIYYSNNYNQGCISTRGSASYKTDFEESGETTKHYKLLNSLYNNESLVYGIRLDDKVYAYISVSLVPMNSATLLLKRQLIIMSILILALAAIISYYLSMKVSKPIENISYKASKIAHGKLQGNFRSKTNIVEIHELEDSLNIMKDEFNRTEELRRDLMANVSHDLKTPLTMIKAYAEMVRDLTYENPEKRTENLNVIISESERLNLLVDDILTLSSMQANTIPLEYSVFSIDDMIHSIIDRYEVLLGREQYQFQYERKPYLVHADKKRTEQVIYNIINNAINYTGKDKLVKIKVIEKEKTIRIEVTDTGKGIAKEELSKIWTKYYHSKKKHKRNKIGTGLGLSIVKSILEEYHLPYGIESEVGKGTTFYFELEKGNENE